MLYLIFFFSSRRRHTRYWRDWSSDVCSSDLYLHLDRTGYSDAVKWLAGGLLQAGILAQSGGFFIHLGLGQPNRSSLGTVVTRLGALLIAAALVILAVGLLRSEDRN